MAGPPVIKILFIASESTIEANVIPHFEAALARTSASWTQAVDTMLEVVPVGAQPQLDLTRRAWQWACRANPGRAHSAVLPHVRVPSAASVWFLACD
jgi:hypothetical protein